MNAQNEWDNEPNEKDFECCGLQCHIHRNSGALNLCGYVGIPNDHPWHGKGYNAKVKVPQSVIDREIDIDKIGAINMLCANTGGIEDQLLDMVLAVDVHGGLTYSGKSKPTHDPDGLWWIGFDCAHAGDLSPGYPNNFGDETYKNIDYVEGECCNLAKQLAAIAEAAA